MTNINQLLDGLSQLHPKVIDLSLGRLLSLLKKLDNPHLKLPPTIHIAGTNGKGSTQAFLKSILQAHGKTVHAYTSPHLVKFNERIELCGQAISDDDLSELILEVQKVNDGEAITFFEVTTAIAFLAFSRVPADYLLLEVGLGGRFDATNVIEQSVATAITPIDIDHQEFLGSDIVKIAAEKAGILRKNTPSYWAKQQKVVTDELVRQAKNIDCPYKQEGTNWLVTPKAWQMGKNSLPLTNLGLKGVHQNQNAALALSLLKDILGDEFDDTKALLGLKNVSWPARLQQVGVNKFLPTSFSHELWLDGAHNPHGAKALAAHIKDQWGDQPIYLIMGMLNNRNADEWLESFDGLIAEAVTIPLTSTTNGHSPQDLQYALQKRDIKSTAFMDMPSAFEYLSHLPKGRILMAGSLYMIGEFLSQI